MMDAPILIQGQIDIERDYLFSVIENDKSAVIGSALFHSGTLYGYPCVMMDARYGQANAAMNTAVAICNFHPRLVINQGTAGGHRTDLHVGDVVLATAVVNVNSFRSLPRARGEGERPEDWEVYMPDVWQGNKRNPTDIFFPDPYLFSTAEKALMEAEDFRVANGIVVSGDMWNEETDRIERIAKKHGSSCEEMELFSVAQVCYAFNLPWVGMRTLTNNILNGGEYDPAAGVNAQKAAILVAKRLIEAF